MKPFDLEKAKAGHPVCTRDGRDARIICFDRKGPLPIVALVTDFYWRETALCFNDDGSFNDGGCCHPVDLFMKPTKTTYYINVYTNPLNKITTIGSSCESEEGADSEVKYYGEYNFVKRISFEIEE